MAALMTMAIFTIISTTMQTSMLMSMQISMQMLRNQRDQANKGNAEDKRKHKMQQTPIEKILPTKPYMTPSANYTMSNCHMILHKIPNDYTISFINYESPNIHSKPTSWRICHMTLTTVLKILHRDIPWNGYTFGRRL